MPNYFISQFKVTNPETIRKVLNADRDDEWIFVDKNDCISYNSSRIRRDMLSLKIAAGFIFKKKRADKLIFWSTSDAFVLSLLSRFFPFKRKMRITSSMFIYYPGQGFKGKLKRKYYSFCFNAKIFNHIVVHSKFELEKCRRTFPKAKDKFVYIPVGVPLKDAGTKTPVKGEYLFSVGRDNRDYKFLIDALKDTGHKVIIATTGLEQPDCDNITVMNDCFGQKMYDIMAGAFASIIPLKESNPNVSSGQTVLLQSKHVGTPVIITSIPTIADYIKQNETGILIKNTKEELLSAIDSLKNDAALYNRIRENGIKETEGTFFTPEGLMTRLSQLAHDGNSERYM